MDKNTKIKSVCHIEAHTAFKQCIDTKKNPQRCLQQYKYQIANCIQINSNQSLSRYYTYSQHFESMI